MQPLPPTDRRGRFGSLTLVLVLLLALVAISSRSGFGGNGDEATVNPTYVSYAMSVFLIVFIVMIPVAIYSYVMRTKEIGPEGRDPGKRTWRILLGLVLLAGLGFVTRVWIRGHHAFFHNQGLFGSHRPPRAGAGLKHGKGVTPQPHFEYSVLWVALALGAVLAVAAIVAWKRRPPREPEAERTFQEEFVATIDDAIDDLEREPDPRRAVIAAYARMERVLGRQGLQRKHSETAVEYLRRVLHDLTSSGGGVERLTGLFEQAKFSSHEITQSMKHDAISSLRDIRAGVAT